MFNLDQAITEWRRQMIAGGIKTSAVLDELESHLREDAERQMHSGMNQRQVFEAAARRIGDSDLLKAEFAKIAGLQKVRPAQVIGIGCSVFAGLYSLLLVPHLFTIHELSPGQRVLGMAAVALTLFSVASWRFSYRYLPAIRNHRARKAAGLVCGVAGLAWVLIFAYLLPNVIVPFFLNGGASADSIRGSVLIGLRHASPEGFWAVFMIGISLLWALALASVLGSMAHGLEEAARRQHRNETYV